MKEGFLDWPRYMCGLFKQETANKRKNLPIKKLFTQVHSTIYDIFLPKSRFNYHFTENTGDIRRQ